MTKTRGMLYPLSLGHSEAPCSRFELGYLRQIYSVRSSLSYSPHSQTPGQHEGHTFIIIHSLISQILLRSLTKKTVDAMLYCLINYQSAG
jgi:hypothetical protein